MERKRLAMFGRFICHAPCVRAKRKRRKLAGIYRNDPCLFQSLAQVLTIFSRKFSGSRFWFFMFKSPSLVIILPAASERFCAYIVANFFVYFYGGATYLR